MEKIFRLIDIVDSKLVDQLIYLDRIVKLYGKFLCTYKPAEVKSNGSILSIKIYQINKFGYEISTEGEFAIGDIKKHIELYKEKVRNEFKNRHTNLRLLRDKESLKWENYIKDAEV